MKVLNVLNKKGNTNTTFAIVNPNSKFSANVTDGTLYIGADSFKSDQWAKDIIHEVTHLEEGTKEWNDLYNAIDTDEILVNDGKGNKVSLHQLASNTVVKKGYLGKVETQADFDQRIKELNEIIDKAKSNETLTKQEQETLELYKSELVAHESELYLGSVDFIERIIKSDVSLPKKIFNKILGVKQALTKADKNNAELKQ